MLKFLLSKEERYLIKKNKKFTLGQKKLYYKDTTDSDDMLDLKSYQLKSQRKKWLLKNAFRIGKESNKHESRLVRNSQRLQRDRLETLDQPLNPKKLRKTNRVDMRSINFDGERTGE